MNADQLARLDVNDLALVLYLPEPTIELRDGEAYCLACNERAGAHYCLPREAARRRLSEIVKDALR